MTPLVSVVMPVLNAAPFLKDSVESILTQTLGDLEFVIVDDGSTDGSQDIIADYARRDGRLRTLFLERDPEGRSGARATRMGAQIAAAPLLARMDADDIALPHKFETQLAYMRAHDLDVCGAEMAYFGAKEKPVWFPQGQDAMRREMLFRIVMPHPSMVFAAGVFRAVTPREDVHAEDYVWQTQLIRRYRMGNVPEVLLRNRVHAAQTTTVKRAQIRKDYLAARMPYFFAEWPQARMDDFIAISRIADGVRFAEVREVELAGSWLAKLADLPDAKLRARMARRWRESEALVAGLGDEGMAVFARATKTLDGMAG